MLIKGLTDEDFVNYKKPSMVIATSKCDFKCDRDCGEGCCQNSPLARAKSISVSDDDIILRYMANDITSAIVFAGLEPFEQFWEVFDFIKKLRNDYHCRDTVVIYTGFNKTEISQMVDALIPLGNIIIKFGRFVPHQEKKYDDVLGIYLASPNQYAEVIC